MEDVRESQGRGQHAGTEDPPDPGEGAFSLMSRAHSFRNAGRGIAMLLAGQHNAWIHAVGTAAVIALGLYLGVSLLDWCALILAMVAVWTAECLNTAIEVLADAVSSDWDPLIGQAKDVAAGGVLIAAIGAGVIGLIVLGPPLLRLF
jgi:diacylglycerol kinase (ATP)